MEKYLRMPPMVKIELTMMKEQIVHAMISRTDEFNEMLEEAVNKAMEQMPQIVMEKTRYELKKCMEEQIEKYFQYGPGKKIVEILVKDSMYEGFEKVMKEGDVENG